MIGPPVEAWIRAFVLTCAVELPIVVALTRSSALGWRRRAALAFFAQLMTHPMVWYIFPAMPWLSAGAAFTASELWAWLGEAALYAMVGMTRRPLPAVGVAAVANGASLGLGMLLRW